MKGSIFFFFFLRAYVSKYLRIMNHRVSRLLAKAGKKLVYVKMYLKKQWSGKWWKCYIWGIWMKDIWEFSIKTVFAFFFSSLFQSKKKIENNKTKICEFTIQIKIQTVTLRNPVPFPDENPPSCATGNCYREFLNLSTFSTSVCIPKSHLWSKLLF